MTDYTIVAREIGQGRYTVSLDGEDILTSRRPYVDAARLLHGRGAADDDRLICRSNTSQHVSFATTIGAFRKLTVTETDRGTVRFVKWSPSPYAKQADDAALLMPPL